MFHATSARLARLAQHIRDRRLRREQHVAAVNGWQVRRVAAGTYQFHDPRFEALSGSPDAPSLAQVGGDHHD